MIKQIRARINRCQRRTKIRMAKLRKLQRMCPRLSKRIKKSRKKKKENSPSKRISRRIKML